MCRLALHSAPISLEILSHLYTYSFRKSLIFLNISWWRQKDVAKRSSFLIILKSTKFTTSISGNQLDISTQRKTLLKGLDAGRWKPRQPMPPVAGPWAAWGEHSWQRLAKPWIEGSGLGWGLSLSHKYSYTCLPHPKRRQVQDCIFWFTVPEWWPWISTSHTSSELARPRQAMSHPGTGSHQASRARKVHWLWVPFPSLLTKAQEPHTGQAFSFPGNVSVMAASCNRPANTDVIKENQMLGRCVGWARKI